MKIAKFEAALRAEEKAEATVAKYLAVAREFEAYCGGEITKERVIAYKNEIAGQYSPAGVNARLCAVNRFLTFLGRGECRVKLLRIQRQLFAREERTLTAAEYQRLVRAAGERRIGYVLQTICGTGIRVSELQYITAEAVRAGRAVVDCKGKRRVILFSAQVRNLLLRYMKKAGITSGSVFVSKNGRPLDRSNIWREMKSLCHAARVAPGKVFPHNLRHLFARLFYKLEKDIVRLADLLGHSSVETTRIYTLDASRKYQNCVNHVGRMIFTTE